MLFFPHPPNLNHPPASAPQSHLQGREGGREGEGAGSGCALMCGERAPEQRQERLASSPRPLSLQRRPRADLCRAQGTGGHGRNDNENTLGHRAEDGWWHLWLGRMGWDGTGGRLRTMGEDKTLPQISWSKIKPPKIRPYL